MTAELREEAERRAVRCDRYLPFVSTTLRALARDHERLEAENAELRQCVIAFGGPWAVEYAKAHGFPAGHLHPTHFDILARAGARMTDFTRGTVPQAPTANDATPGRQAPPTPTILSPRNRQAGWSGFTGYGIRKRDGSST